MREPAVAGLKVALFIKTRHNTPPRPGKPIQKTISTFVCGGRRAPREAHVVCDRCVQHAGPWRFKLRRATSNSGERRRASETVLCETVECAIHPPKYPGAPPNSTAWARATLLVTVKNSSQPDSSVFVLSLPTLPSFKKPPESSVKVLPVMVTRLEPPSTDSAYTDPMWVNVQPLKLRSVLPATRTAPSGSPFPVRPWGLPMLQPAVPGVQANTVD